MSDAIRSGKGGKAARRASVRLKRATEAKGLVCSWCGLPIDTTLPRNDPMAFTADHPTALAVGGELVGQAMTPMHRRCNASKGSSVEIDLNQWSAS